MPSSFIEQIGDLQLLRAETHKFESHYTDNLVGNYLIKNVNDLFVLSISADWCLSVCVEAFCIIAGDEKAYFERSPINFVDHFSCPIILFQGLEDKASTACPF